MSTAFLDRQRDQAECDGQHRHANHAREDIHGSLAGKAKTLLLGIGLQIIARGQGVGKGRGIEADRSLQAVVASLLNGGRGALGVPLTPGVTRGQQAQRRGHDKHGDQDERGDQRGLLGSSALGSKLAIDGLGPDDNARRRLLNETVDGGRRHALDHAGNQHMRNHHGRNGNGQREGAVQRRARSVSKEHGLNTKLDRRAQGRQAQADPAAYDGRNRGAPALVVQTAVERTEYDSSGKRQHESHVKAVGAKGQDAAVAKQQRLQCECDRDCNGSSLGA